MPSSLSDTLFSTTQQKVLALLYGTPDKSFYTNEIARWAQVGKGSLVRELNRLQSAGVLIRFRQGNQTHYQANTACPIYAELLGIVRKTFGIREPLLQALQPLTQQLAWAFIYGSIARGTDHARSDIDLMLIGDGLQYTETMAYLLPAEKLLNRTINPTLMSVSEWLEKKKAGSSFVLRVTEQDKIEVIGQDPEALTDESHGQPAKPGSHR